MELQLQELLFLKRFCLPAQSNVLDYENAVCHIKNCICGRYYHIACIFKNKLCFKEGKYFDLWS